MTQIYIKGAIVRDSEQVLAALAEPIRRRRAYVDRVAHSRSGVERTHAEWIRWYEHNPLTEDDFKACLNEWKSDVQFSEKTLA
jgi:hypothetical protein